MPVVPTRIVNAGNAPELQVLNLRAGDYPRFFCVLDPQKYAYFPQVNMVLPVVGALKLVPGIGGVDHRSNPDLAIVAANKLGRIVVMPDQVDYLTEYQMKPQDSVNPQGKPGYLWIWDQVEQHGNIVEITVNWDKRLTFALDCYEKGLIQTPSPIMLRRLLAQYQQQSRIMRQRTDHNARAWDNNQDAIQAVQNLLKDEVSNG